MTCHICLKEDEVFRLCECFIKVHKRCIEKWHDISYSTMIRKGNLLCPQCKNPDNAKLDYLIKTLNKDPKLTYILCGLCKYLNKYIEESCTEYIDETFSLICSDCASPQYKECPLVEKVGSCNHIKCNYGTHWCWICKEITYENDIYTHIDENHRFNFDGLNKYYLVIK